LQLKDLLTLSRTIIIFILQFCGFYWKGELEGNSTLVAAGFSLRMW
jgi:hypothetical protein